MKMKVAELIGAQLDWAVAKCEGVHGSSNGYSTDQYQGGPIMEREGIFVQQGNDLYFPKGNENGDFYEPLWLASILNGYRLHGKTPLIAAMRCFVYSKLGEEVEIPEELK